jgi:hypothetical protein
VDNLSIQQRKWNVKEKMRRAADKCAEERKSSRLPTARAPLQKKLDKSAEIRYNKKVWWI